MTSRFWCVIKEHFIKQKNIKFSSIKLAQTNNEQGYNGSGLIEDSRVLRFLYPFVEGSFRLNAPIFVKVLLVM